jgi:actin related protein 2/3 complex, subunit 1A/1B
LIDNRKMGRGLDDTTKSSSSRENEPSAFNMFRNMDRKGTAKAASEDTSLPTVHQNTITCDYYHIMLTNRMLRAYDGGAGGVSKIVSSGLDGRIVIWDVNDSGLEGRMGGMSLRR